MYIYIYRRRTILTARSFPISPLLGSTYFRLSLNSVPLNSYYLEEMASRPREFYYRERVPRGISRVASRYSNNFKSSSSVARSKARFYSQVCRNGVEAREEGREGRNGRGARKHVVVVVVVWVWVVAYYLCSSRVSFVHYFALTEWSVFSFALFCLPSPFSSFLHPVRHVGTGRLVPRCKKCFVEFARDSSFRHAWLEHAIWILPDALLSPLFPSFSSFFGFSFLSLSKRARAPLRNTQLRTANRVNAYGDRACPYYQATTGV